MIGRRDQKLPLCLSCEKADVSVCAYVCVGGAGLMPAGSSWTDRQDRHAVFVSDCSERQSVGLRQRLQVISSPDCCSARARGAAVRVEGLSTVHCFLCRYSQARRMTLVFLLLLFFFFWPKGSTLSHLSFLFFNRGWQFSLSHSSTLSSLVLSLLCSASFFATSFEG